MLSNLLVAARLRTNLSSKGSFLNLAERYWMRLEVGKTVPRAYEICVAFPLDINPEQGYWLCSCFPITHDFTARKKMVPSDSFPPFIRTKPCCPSFRSLRICEGRSIYMDILGVSNS